MSARKKVTTGFLVLLLFLGFSYFWLSGKIQIRADILDNCQGSRKVSAFLGKPGARLVNYNLFGYDLSVHELIVPYLNNIQAEFTAEKIQYTFDDIDSFNNRSVRGGGGKSMHSWGTAFDINPQRNPFWGNKKGEMEKDIPDSLVNIFKANGFFWGGDWAGNRDPMHFEWYPSEVDGAVVDTLSGQIIPYAVTFYNNYPIVNTNGEYAWVLPYGTHNLSATAVGYPDQKIAVDLTCFTKSDANISMQPYSGEIAGSISGHINNYSRYHIFRPTAGVYLDGKLMATVDSMGNYLIPGVSQGSHTVDVRFLFVKAGTGTFDLKAGQHLTGADINLGT